MGVFIRNDQYTMSEHYSYGFFWKSYGMKSQIL